MRPSRSLASCLLSLLAVWLRAGAVCPEAAWRREAAAWRPAAGHRPVAWHQGAAWPRVAAYRPGEARPEEAWHQGAAWHRVAACRLREARPEEAWLPEEAYPRVAAYRQGEARPVVASHPVEASPRAEAPREAVHPAGAWQHPGAAWVARCSVHWPRRRPVPASRSAQSFSPFRSPSVKVILGASGRSRVVLKSHRRQGGFARAQGPTIHRPANPILSTSTGAYTALYLIESAATLAFALSGVVEAARRRLDAVGVVVVAGLAAFGGGTLRDVLLDRRPFFWVTHTELLWAVLCVGIGAMVFMRRRHLEPTERAMQWPDAVGMGLFAASGTQISLSMGQPALVSVILGMVTAVFGGVLRDIVCNDIPKVFRDHRPYALLAFLGGWVLVLADTLGAPSWLGLSVAAVVATALRMLAIWRAWTIPTWLG